MKGDLKLDWFPLYFQRLKASSAWKMIDYKCCWYGKLLIEAADSDMPGYLPNDIGELWRLAGAKTERFFRQNGGPELIADYFTRTDDGRWIYNERMLNVLHTQNKKLTKRRKKDVASLSLCIQELPDWIPKEEFGQFIEMRKAIGKELTAHAVKLAVTKLEKLKGEGHEPKGVLEQSIFNGWQGLWPLHQDGANGTANGAESNGTRPTLTDAHCPTCSGTGWEQTARGVKECACRIKARGKVSQTPVKT